MQVVFAGKTSTSLEISSGPPSVPPVIMRPARGGDFTSIQDKYRIFAQF